jgi:hypothetical protein
MEEELEVGKNYTVEFLLDFLSQNYRQNIFLTSANGIDLISLPRDKNFVVNEIQSGFLHKCINPSTYTKNETKIYHIKPTT